MPAPTRPRKPRCSTPDKAEPDIVTCDACPVLCRIRPGRTGACDRYGNVDGMLTRMDPFTLAARTPDLVRFAGDDWSGNPIEAKDLFVTAIGAGTTYPDYKPAPFIVAQAIDGVDMVTVVSEGVFSYCGLKVKIDTDRHLGPETATVRAKGEPVGHVTTAEYGSQMLSLGGVHHLTGGGKKEGVVTCETMLRLANAEPVELTHRRRRPASSCSRATRQSSTASRNTACASAADRQRSASSPTSGSTMPMR